MSEKEIQRTHWSHIYSLIAKEERDGIAVMDLATELSLSKVTPELETTLSALDRAGKIRQYIGRSRDGLMCRCVMITREKEGDWNGRSDEGLTARQRAERPDRTEGDDEIFDTGGD